MAKTEAQLKRQRLWEKLHRVRKNRRKVPPKITGRKICKVCRKRKAIAYFGTHPYSPDGRRYECRLCRWIERYQRQAKWSAIGPSTTAMRRMMKYRKAERVRVTGLTCKRTWAQLGFPILRRIYGR